MAQFDIIAMAVLKADAAYDFDDAESHDRAVYRLRYQQALLNYDADYERAQGWMRRFKRESMQRAEENDPR